MIAGIVIGIVVYVLSVIGMWKAFRKAGRWGWLSIIPVVNSVVICLIGWRKAWPVVLEIVLGGLGTVFTLVGFIFALVTLSGGMLALAIIGIVLLIIALIIYIMITHRFSKSFGHKAGFTVGLILIPLIMYIVLGFGKSEYIYEKKRDFSKNKPVE